MITKNIRLSGDDLVKKLTEVPFKKKTARTGHPTTYANDLKLLHELQVQKREIEMQNEQLRSNKFDLDELIKRYNELFEFAPNGYFALNQIGAICEVNLTGANLLGINKGYLIHQLFLNFIYPEDQETFKVCWFNLMETREYQVFKVRLFKADGQQLYVRIALTITEGKNESQILLAMTDITLVKQMEDAQSFLLGCSWVKTGNDFFHALAEYLAKNLGLDCVRIDKLLEGTQEAHSVAVFCDGYFKENIRFKINETAISKIVEQKSFCFLTDVCNSFSHDNALLKLNAESFTGVTLWGTGGMPIGLISVIGRRPLMDLRLIEMVLRQVSIRAAAELEQRQLEEEIIQSRDELELLLREKTAELEKSNEHLRNEINIRQQHEQSLIMAEEKYRTVSDYTFDWETWLNPDGTFNYIAPSCKRISGYRAEEFMQNPDLFLQIVHPDDRDRLREHFTEELKVDTHGCSFDYRITTRDGEELWMAHHCQPVFDANGKYLGQRASNYDITQRKIAQNTLLDSQNRLRQLTKRMDAITEEERTRIAREIHDELGHLLMALKYDMDTMINESNLSMESVKSEVNIMIGMVDSLIDSVRKIATELRPGILDHLGLFPAIEWQIRQFRSRTKICCSFTLSEMEVTFDKNETTIIYRIVQEILTNITRHSKANHVQVLLTKEENYFVLKVCDNGVGFEPNEKNKLISLGLMGMQERAMSIGGELQIESTPGKGTTITFILPKVEKNMLLLNYTFNQFHGNSKNKDINCR